MNSLNTRVASIPNNGRFRRSAYSLAFRPDGSAWVAGCHDGALFLFVGDGLVPEAYVRGRPMYRELLFDAGGDQMFVSSRAVARVGWESKQVAPVKYRGHQFEPSSLALSHEGTCLYTASGGPKDYLRAFDVASGALLWKARPTKTNHRCEGVVVSKAGLFAAWSDGTLHLHAGANGVSISRLPLCGVNLSQPLAMGSGLGIGSLPGGTLAAWVVDSGAPRVARFSVCDEALKEDESFELSDINVRAIVGRPVFDTNRGVMVLGVTGLRGEAHLSLLVIDMSRRVVVDEAHLDGASQYFAWALSTDGVVIWTRSDGIGYAQLLPTLRADD